ncbi:hypothetical protein TKK_0006278 [Trichogramma kaykai]
MNSKEDITRVKEEPNDTWPDAGDDYDFNSVDSSEIKNVEAVPFYTPSAKPMNKVMAIKENADQKIFVDFECKNVKLELTSLSTTTSQNSATEVATIQYIVINRIARASEND